MTTHTTGSFTFADWQEKVIAEAGGSGDRGGDGASTGSGPKLASAVVTNHFTGGIEAAGTSCAYTIVYTAGEPGSAGSFTGHELLSGALDGRTGSFALAEHGTFDEKGTVRCVFEVVPGSATGELAGLRGTGGFTAVHGEPSVAYAFDYELG
ncbi:DUF3224 domain-containing protein [Streptomyces verrucosisporus]|uniref:DUF3224 domain-containing protein n=1 Tax=Streptomyces verrucosisporus TaxID=1695161 RepID=UPI0019D18649|nr:DUF3224 domain-containing protein [Streptomyces verrucosisporus]MBN3931233.1 DUF3224 domain-containing protein [Streptomyces verrucosisporus]